MTNTHCDRRFRFFGRLLLVVAATGATAAFAHADPAPGTPEFALHVLNRIDDMYRGEQSHGIMVMEVKTRHWQRSMSLESWSKGKDYSLVRILEPKKERGTATLKARNDLFSYLSKTGRTIKIAGGMMGSSWMGSHFTNDDLMRETRLADDYTARQLPAQKVGGVEVYRFELQPRPNRPVVWGKVEVVVRAADLLPVSERFFDEDGKAVRSLELSEVKTVSGRSMPTVMVMRPLDGTGESTKVTWKEISFDVKLAADFFSVRNLSTK